MTTKRFVKRYELVLVLELHGEARLKCLHSMFVSLDFFPILYLKMLFWCSKAPRGDGESREGPEGEEGEEEEGSVEEKEKWFKDSFSLSHFNYALLAL